MRRHGHAQRRAARRRRKVARFLRRARARVGVVTRKLGVHEQVRRIVRFRERRVDGSGLIGATAARLHASTGPVLVGPWIEEVGFEVLYWIPFLRRLAEQYELDTSQWVVVSRGGTRSWYGELAGGGYADVLDVWSPQEFREANEERWREVGSQKQRFDSDVEERLLHRLVSAGAIPSEYELLHPSSMYEPFWHPWKESGPDNLVQRSTLYRPLPPPGLPEGLDLPSEFTAVKWYFRPSLPDTSENRARIRSLTSALAEELPVVLLHDQARLDDHEEMGLAGIPNVWSVLGSVPPAKNLEVQSAVIARATSYVGTYGGLGYLPMLYGVPSRLYASHIEHLSSVHVRTGLEVATQLGVPHALVDLNDPAC